MGRGLGAYNPDNTKPNYLLSYLSKGNNDRVNTFDIYSSNKSVPGFNPEWQKRIDIGNLSNQVMKTPIGDFPNYKSVGAGWKDNMRLYELAKEYGTGFNPPPAYNVGKNRYLGLGAFVSPIQEPIPDRKELLDYKYLPTNLGNLGGPKVDMKTVHTTPPNEPFRFASNVPWLGIMGGLLGGRWSAKGGEGLHDLGDANKWTRMTHLKGEKFGGPRPGSTAVGAGLGFLGGSLIDYGAPWLINKTLGTNYPTNTTLSNISVSSSI